MYQSFIDAKKQNIEIAIERFISESAKIRTGRATPALVEHLSVDHYGTRSPLKQIASVTAPEARLLVISPWDKGAVAAIETALREADLGFNPTNDGRIIRIVVPALTEERRRDLVKALSRLAEEARIAIRTIREEVWRDIQNAEREGILAEDDKFRGKEALQELVDGANARIEELREKKESEIMTV